jgi:hypothetical protein
MSLSSAVMGTSGAGRRSSVECRVWQRFPCQVPASCQPVAARSDGDVRWPATLRDLSIKGVGLILGRRFEPGAALAIELPATPTRPANTLLARVVHATAQPGGRWLLGCSLVSELSLDELESITGMARKSAVPAPAETRPPSRDHVLAEVVFEWLRGGPAPRQFHARRLFLTGKWPLAPGTVLRVRRGNTPRGGAWLRVKVHSCIEHYGRWFVACSILDEPASGVLRSLGLPARS